MNKKGQIFTLDLFVSLILVMLVLALSSVLIDRSISQAYDSVLEMKLNNLAADYASFEYYQPSGSWQINAYNAYLFVGKNKPTGEYATCVSFVRGTGDHEVTAYACQ